MEENNFEGFSRILNPIVNVNGYLTYSNQIYDPNWLGTEKTQSEINSKLRDLAEIGGSGTVSINMVEEYYAIYNSSKYTPIPKPDGSGNYTMKDDPSIEWVKIPNDKDKEFPRMTTENPYLWNYEVFNKTDSGKIETEPIVISVLGKGIKSTNRFYLVSGEKDENGNPIAPFENDTRWQDKSPATTDSCPWLWEKQLIYYTDNFSEGVADETIITLIGTKGDKGVDGTDVEYIFCKWPSRDKGPLNPTPKNYKENDDYQKKPDYIPDFKIEEGSELTGYEWSDDPVSLDKTDPAQWVCKREKKVWEENVAPYWGEYSKPSLFSTYGEDGVSIKKIETWYLISDLNTLNSTIETAQTATAEQEAKEEKENNLWYKNSPAVTETYRYLWKKTILSFSEGIFDNPETEDDETRTTTSIRFEVVGSLGTPGIDGDTVEWIYTKTKESDEPKASLEGDDPEDINRYDYIPHPTIADFNNPEKGVKYYWSDDIQPCDDEYIYAWRAKRVKVNGTWGQFGTPVKFLYYVKDGVSPNAAFKSIVFCRSAEKPEISSKTIDGYNTYENPIPPASGENGKYVWFDGIPEISENDEAVGVLWSSTRIFSNDGEAPQQSEWSEPQLMSDTLDVEFIYSPEENKKDIPGNFERTDIWWESANKAGWFNNPEEISGGKSAIWMAVSRRVNNSWSDWQISKIKGERGDDGTSIKVAGHYSSEANFKTDWQKGENEWRAPQEGPATEDFIQKKEYPDEACFVVEGNLYVWDGSDEWINAGKFTGDPGKTIFFHAIYAKNVDGDDITLSEDNTPNKYIATFTSEIQTLSDIFIKGAEGIIVGVNTINGEVALSGLPWTRWIGEDGYGYEYIYILTNSSEAPTLPNYEEIEINGEKTNEFEFKEPEDYQNPDYVPEGGWSDNPLTTDKDNSYCWQAYRIRVDGVWQPWRGHSNTTEAVLWNKFGKDGLTLYSKSWYCITTREATKDHVTAYKIPLWDKENNKWIIEDTGAEVSFGTEKLWWENSPEITEDYPNLWKRTWSEYKEVNDDNTVGVESQVTYELIGSKGTPGVDGTDIEWAYILTKENICPTSNSTDYFYVEKTSTDETTTPNPSTETTTTTSTTSAPGKTTIINGLWPRGEITSNVKGKWTDDPQDVDEEWPYQWIVKRSKVDNKWTEWGIKQYDIDGNTYYKASRETTFGTHIKDTVSFYKTSSEDIEIPSANNYTELEKLLLDENWIKSGIKQEGDNSLELSPENNKLFEITVFIYTDNSYSVTGPIVKDEWKDTNIQSNVFCRSAEKPETPGDTEGSYSDPYPGNSYDSNYWWFDGIPDFGQGPEGHESSNFNKSTTVWTTSAVFKATDTNGPTVKKWSTPIQLTDSSDIQIRYSAKETKPEKPDDEGNGNDWTDKATSDAIWMAIRTKSYGNWNEWNITRIKGEAGKDAPGANLILNSAFDDETNKLEHWTINTGKEYKVSDTPAWEYRVNSVTANGSLQQELSDLTPESYYTLSFRISVLKSNTVSIVLNDLDSIYNYSDSLDQSQENNNWIFTPKDNNLSNKLFFITFKTRELEVNENKPWVLKFSYNHHNDQTLTNTYTYTIHSIKLEAGKVYSEYQRAQEDLKGRYITDTLTHYATTTQYYSDPGNNISSTDWKESIPEGNLANGLYLWTRTTIKYTKGLDTVSYSVSRTGIDGRGIQNSTTYYYVSKEPVDDIEKTNIPWSTTYPNAEMLKEGWWLYTKTVVTYSDGMPTDTYSSAQIGTGSYYAGLQEYYRLGESAEDAPTGYPIKTGVTDGGYVDGVASFTKNENLTWDTTNWTSSRPKEKSITTPYLWNFSISRDSNGNQYVCYPICIGNYAKGIDTIHELYAISSYSEKDLKIYNNNSGEGLLFPPDITDSDWDDEDFNSIPTEEKPYQWNKTITTYDDDLSTQDIFYHVSAVKNKDTQPNILKNSNFDVYDYDKDGKIAYWTFTNSNFFQINENGYLSYNSIKTKASGVHIVKQTLPSMYKGDKFTFSCIARIGNTTSTNNSGITITKLNDKVKVSNEVGLKSGGVNEGYDFWFDTNTEWSKKSFTIECISDEGIESPVLSLYVWSGWGEYSMLKYEKSEVATPYVKHVDDNKAFSPVVADLDNEMDSIVLNSDGTIVGDSTITLTTNVWMYEGSNKLTLSSVTPTNPGIEGVTVNNGISNNTEGYVTVTFEKGKSITVSKITIPITITATDSKKEVVTRNLSFVISAVRPGADGKPAVAYKLIPSANSIVRKKNGGGFQPETLTFYGQTNTGGEIKNITSGTDAISYYLNGEGNYSALSFKDTANVSNAKLTLSSLNLGDNIKFIKFNWRIKDVNVDIETIPILKEGEDGQDGTDGLSPEPNLLINSNFDLYENGKLKGWTSQPSHTEIVVKEKEFNGFNSVYKKSNSSTTFLITTTPVLESGTYYTFSFYYKCNVQSAVILRSSTGNNYVVSGAANIVSSDNDNVFSSTNKDINCNFSKSTTWRKVFITFKTNIKESIELRFYYNPATETEIYISQPKLELGKAYTPYTKNQNDLVGPAGGSGKNMYPAGNWDSTREYKIENNSVPFVYYESNYYILLTESSEKNDSNVIPGQDDTVWGIFEYTPFQFSEFLMAKWAKFGGDNGAVFYDRYLFSQKGINSEGNSCSYEDYADVMFKDNGTLDGRYFTPSLSIDMLSGSIKTNKYSDTMQEYQYQDSDKNPKCAMEISLETSYNIKVDTTNWDKYISELPILAMPLTHSITDENDNILIEAPWEPDGIRCTIIVKANRTWERSMRFALGGNNAPGYTPFKSVAEAAEGCLLLCADSRWMNPVAWQMRKNVSGEYEFSNVARFDELEGVANYNPEYGYFCCGGTFTNFILVEPGATIQLRSMKDSYENTYWHIENMTDFETIDFTVKYQISKIYFDGKFVDSNDGNEIVSKDLFGYHYIGGSSGAGNFGYKERTCVSKSIAKLYNKFSTAENAKATDYKVSISIDTSDSDDYFTGDISKFDWTNTIISAIVSSED